VVEISEEDIMTVPNTFMITETRIEAAEKEMME